MAATDHGTISIRWATPLAVLGFVAVAFAQVTNMILARANAGAIPPFSLAFFRWLIVAVGLAPFAFKHVRAHGQQLWSRAWLIALTGFLGMFLCGAPVYEAGVSTTAINIALIMALSPVIVLITASLMGSEKIGATQLVGTAAALAGALIVVTRGDPHAVMGATAMRGDALVVVAMLGWSGYTLLQFRAAAEIPFISRVCLFAAVGALASLPFAVMEAAAAPERVFSWHAATVYLLAGVVPGIFAYGGFAYLGAKFGSARSSLVLYVGPVASAALSFLILGEAPQPLQIVGGALILAGVWCSLKKA
jgi:drug/metabolite transporter (DMT)-like permease